VPTEPLVLPFADGAPFLAAKLCDLGTSPERRRLVAVAGPSQSGKTHFALTSEHACRRAGLGCVHISMDDYYRTTDELAASGTDIDFDAPAAVDLTRLADDVRGLMAGRPVPHRVLHFHEEHGRYSTTFRRQEGTIDSANASVVIVEGLFVHHQPIRALADVLVMVRHVSDERRLELRLHRDVSERGFDEAVARDRWFRYVEPGARTHVVPPGFEQTFRPDVVLLNTY
jgi:uridine kinase